MTMFGRVPASSTTEARAGELGEAWGTVDPNRASRLRATSRLHTIVRAEVRFAPSGRDSVRLHDRSVPDGGCWLFSRDRPPGADSVSHQPELILPLRRV